MEKMRFLLIAGTMLLFVPVQAQDAGSQKSHDWSGWGVRVGLADDPDQVIIGGQYDFGEIADRVHFEPNVELGIGDDHTILSGTAAFHYHFPSANKMRPYAGGGLAVGLVDSDRPGRNDDTDFEIALKAVGGFRWPLKSGNEFFLELDLVFGDLHDTQVLAGWRF